MIEINLLPPQYRTVERTPLPVFVGLIGAILLVAGMLGWLGVLKRQGDRLAEKKVQLQQVHQTKAKEVDEINKIKKEIADASGRIDTVLGIAESKVYWAEKLDQLTHLLPNYAWIESMNMDGNSLKLQCKARGTTFQHYTELRQKLRNDVNFMYHFDPIPFSAIQVVSPGTQFVEPQVLSFGLTLPLKSVEPAPAAKK